MNLEPRDRAFCVESFLAFALICAMAIFVATIAVKTVKTKLDCASAQIASVSAQR